MKRTLIALISAASLSVCTAAFAADASKPDCSEKQKAYDTANSAVKSAGMPDLASCKDKKGQGQDRLREAAQGQGEGRREGGQGHGETSQDGARLLQEPEEEGLHAVASSGSWARAPPPARANITGATNLGRK